MLLKNRSVRRSDQNRVSKPLSDTGF